MGNAVRVLHYLNQFFGGIGGEDHTDLGVQTKEGSVGPGRVLQHALGDDGQVVATVIAGDNYFVQETTAALKSVEEALQRFQPDVVVAGPAFDAGRYGLACAEMCRFAQAKGIPAVTAMTSDNAGVLTYRRDLICVPTGISSGEMQQVLQKVAGLALRLGRGGELGPAHVEGYLPRGIRKAVTREESGAERAVDMLEALVLGRPFTSEVRITPYETIQPARPLECLEEAVIGLVTVGGIVPKGNPDRLGTARAEKVFRYRIEGQGELRVEEWESVHGGFNTRVLNTKNPNYALPVPAVRELERKHIIKALYPIFFTTVGNQTAIGSARRMGQEIADEFKRAGVDGVLLVAT